MQRIVVDPVHPEPRKIAFAVDRIARGDVAAYPTDTVYGFGCDMTERSAVERLYKLKNMREDRKLAFLFPDLAAVAHYAVLTDTAYHVCKQIFPGPYTVILEARRGVPRQLMDKRKTVGVRIPEHPVTLALVEKLGRPLLNTSAIWEGESMSDPNDVRDRFEHGIDILVDGGYTDSQPSTVISLVGGVLEIIRVGKGPVDLLEDM